MAVYAVGDLQGCLDPLVTLLEQLAFDPAVDRLWLVGDLVNRGPQSLAVLRFVRELGDAAVVVLGNHDLTLLAAASGIVQPKSGDTYQEVLTAADGPELLQWLRQRPLLHHDAALGYTLVHAGLAPQWDLATAMRCAAEVELALRRDDYPAFMAQLFGRRPDRWCGQLAGYDRLRCSVNYLTRMRYCDVTGRLNYDDKGPPGSQGPSAVPWFELPWRRNAELNIVFGHWASLGYHRAPGIVALDSGCVYGRCLTALRLDHPQRPVYHIDCRTMAPR
ncbi:MAG: symmetrical bis(5'-nucleosyl)-tetraphosphatase [Candidatus Competibacterales bacterium]